MIIALIGGRSVKAIEEVIKKNFDNLEIHAYNSIGHFVNEMSVRSLDVSRMIILQDGVSEEQDLDSLLKNFFEYLATYYPSMRIVSLAKDINITHRIASIFISPLCVHIVSTVVKPRMLLDMVSKDVVSLREEYGYKEIKAGESDIIETVGVNDKDEVEQINEPQKQVKPQEDKKDKKKKGLFGIFRGKDKKKKKGEGYRKEIGQFAYDKEVEKPPQQELILDESLKGTGNTDDDLKARGIVDTNDIQSVEDIGDTSIPDISNFAEEEEKLDDVDFSVFGEGFKHEDNSIKSDEPEEMPKFENINFSTKATVETSNSGTVHVNLEKNNKNNGQVNISAELFEKPVLDIDEKSMSSVEENSIKTEDIFNSGSIENTSVDIQEKPSLDIEDIEHDVINYNDTAQDIDVVIDDKKKRLQGLADFLNTGGVNTDISDIKVSKKDVNLSIETVEENHLGIDNIADLEDKYKEQTAPVVEKVVEKVVKVPMSAGGRNKNGVKFIVVTGDRRTGLTRSALQLASEYAKTDNTLYVDFDIERRGSLAYLDLDDILDCQEFVTNGLGCLGRINNIDKVSYRDMKHGFDCLISLYDNDLTTDDIVKVSKLLSAQRTYSVVVIDCPLSNLAYLSGLLSFSDVLICIESNYLSMVNTLIGLTGTAGLSDDDRLLIFNNGKYVVTKGFNQEAFNDSMSLVAELFSLSEAEVDWSTIPVVATIKNIANLVNTL